MGVVICSNLAWAGLAEKLGYDEQAKILIIHADDAGMCHSVNQATLTAMKDGAVTSAAATVPPAWFPEIAAWARENPELDLDLHLTLTSEWKHYRWQPVADPSLVAGLWPRSSPTLPQPKSKRKSEPKSTGPLLLG